MNRTRAHEMNRRQAGVAVGAWLVSASATPAFAQAGGWPRDKVIRLLCGVSAGGGPDLVARAVAPELARQLNAQGVIVENRPGAGGSIATGQLVTAPADGYTLLAASSAHAVNPAFYPHLPYDTLRDITAIGPLGSSMFVMVTNPDKGYASVADVVARARAQPGKLNYGSGGAGSGSHLNSAKLASATGMDVVHIPFRGAPEAVTELIAGRLDWVFLAAPNALPLVKSGRIQALAVGPAARSSLLPNVPSMTEAGFPEAAYSSWVALFASARTPPLILDRLAAGLGQSIAVPAVRDTLLGMGVEPMPISAARFNQSVRDEVAAMGKLIKDARIKPGE
ncbi:tripartite tricarboxylate transporter substrate-binding protein [Caenimonas aquaedulcis]|uniref:Tripartite tricarboxylate transporter substrate binding protein n=1 Tax=Caenimonas aquaedulcis TaxID=2793270 RepID=A0A931MJR5_9BURK|nr:tripartite tricarboxylate transporter substrate-binding protein [Caenimonas aquaedulcis]MBG9390590.1 tripartite tricarboxylate transporter substrate binding protein [Caenimonas aquaedulcis]